MKKVVELDGNLIASETDFHEQISKALDFPDHYGRNFDALWDCLSGEIVTDIKLVWKNHSRCKAQLGERFDIIIKLFDELHDECDDFEYSLD